MKRYLTHVVAEPYAVEPGLTLAQARAEADRLAVTGFLVVDGDRRLLGLLTARDLLAGEDGDRVEALMTPRERLVTAQPGIGLDEARRLLTANRIEKLPLVAEDGTVAGLVTLRISRSPTAIRGRPATRRVASASRARWGFAVTTSTELGR